MDYIRAQSIADTVVTENLGRVVYGWMRGVDYLVDRVVGVVVDTIDIGHACAHVVIVVGVLEIPQTQSSLLVIDLLYVTVSGMAIIRKYINAFGVVQLYNVILFLFFILESLRPGSRSVVCVVGMTRSFTGTHGVFVWYWMIFKWFAFFSLIFG